MSTSKLLPSVAFLLNNVDCTLINLPVLFLLICLPFAGNLSQLWTYKSWGKIKISPLHDYNGGLSKRTVTLSGEDSYTKETDDFEPPERRFWSQI
jgi:hypothetical protein